jgi:hypothetical protein
MMNYSGEVPVPEYHPESLAGRGRELTRAGSGTSVDSIWFEIFPTFANDTTFSK